MIKRFTLLRRRGDISGPAFRSHWSDVHADIATGFEGLAGYNQNRVQRILWQSGEPHFRIDGIVELWFGSQEAVTRAAASETTQALILDEPNFLSGLTALSVGEAGMHRPDTPMRKLMLIARRTGAAGLQRTLDALVREGMATGLTIEPVMPGFVREGLWAEPSPPDVIASLWLSGDGDDGMLRSVSDTLARALDGRAEAAMLIEADELRVV